jgi:transposase
MMQETSMSLQTQPDQSIPELTVQVARAAFPKGNPYLQLRDELGQVYTDDEFVLLFPTRGQPAEAPGRLALITVFQFAEGLTDRQAADAVRGRIDWKYALALELTDPGFDFSVLSEFRGRLMAGGVEEQLLNHLLTQFKARGLLKARGRQRTDSTHVLAAIRTLNRLEVVGETVRHTLNALSVEQPDWVKAQVPTEWYERYRGRFEQYRLPKTDAERLEWARTVGADGYRLLSAAYAPDAPASVREHAAVELLRQVWVQQYYLDEEHVHWREDDNLPPAERLIQSPYDPEARYSRKRQTGWTGYKVHITETCDDEQPHLITHVETTPATTPDSAVTDTIHTDLARQDLLPGEHLLDAGYMDATHLITSRDEHHIDLVGPVLSDTSWQARAGQGFAVACFGIDWEHQQVTCPQGQVSRVWSEGQDAFDNPFVYVRFERDTCLACPCRMQCTHGADNPRTLKFRPQAQYEALQQARQRQTTPEFKERYAARAGVEGTLSQATRALALRRSRYIGQAKTHLQHILTAVAINLARFVDWLNQVPLATTRTSAFAALAGA